MMCCACRLPVRAVPRTSWQRGLSVPCVAPASRALSQPGPEVSPQHGSKGTTERQKDCITRSCSCKSQEQRLSCTQTCTHKVLPISRILLSKSVTYLPLLGMATLWPTLSVQCLCGHACDLTIGQVHLCIYPARPVGTGVPSYRIYVRNTYTSASKHYQTWSVTVGFGGE